MNPKMDKQQQQWQTESDVDALQRSQEVQADPKRHAKAKAHAKTKLKEHDTKRKQLANVAGGFKQKVKDSSPR